MFELLGFRLRGLIGWSDVGGSLFQFFGFWFGWP